jgi:predicted RND superfamily exporter protein
MGIFIFMALLGINLDVITSLLAALAIGIGVDYAIHFLSACKRLSCSTGLDKGLGSIMRTTGRAIVINTASVTIGFSGLLFSRFIPIQQMGILFCVSMVFAGLSSLTVLPMVLNRWQPKFLLARSVPTPQMEPDDLPKRRISP